MYNKEKNIEEEKEIEIDKSRKKLSIYNKDQGIDITIIEIKPKKDKINSFLEIDDKILELDCKRKSIYILHYPKDKRLVSYGLMKNLEDKIINHYCNTEYGSSGSPILSLDNFKVIGVHYGGSKNKDDKLNFGTFIKYAINEFNKKYNKASTTNEITIKYKIGKEDKIRIFGDEFVKNNKDSFQMIINDNSYELSSYYNIKTEKENEILEIKLKQIKDITNASRMFSECSSLIELPDISKLNMNNVTDMSYIFYKCSELSSLTDISKWNTKNAITLESMFDNCSKLSSLPDISKWNTNNVTNISGLFEKYLINYLDYLYSILKYQVMIIICNIH